MFTFLCFYKRQIQIPFSLVYFREIGHAHSLSRVPFFATLWTAACQALLSMECSRQEYWSGLPFPASGALLDPGIEPVSLVSPALAGGFFIAMKSGFPIAYQINS